MTTNAAQHYYAFQPKRSKSSSSEKTYCLLFFLSSFFVKITHILLLPPLHNLCAHFHKTSFGFRVREEGNSIDGFIDVFLGEGTGLLEA